MRSSSKTLKIVQYILAINIFHQIKYNVFKLGTPQKSDLEVA